MPTQSVRVARQISVAIVKKDHLLLHKGRNTEVKQTLMSQVLEKVVQITRLGRRPY